MATIEVPVYKSRVDRAGVPGYQQNSRDTASEALGGVGDALQNTAVAAGRIAKKVADEQNQAALMEARAKLIDTKLSLLDDKDNGLVAQRGKNALQNSQSYIDNFDHAAEEISAGLGNGEQRAAFRASFANERLSFRSTVDTHVARESDALAKQGFESTLDSSNSDAMAHASRGEFDKVPYAIAMGQAAINLRAEHEGWTAADVEQKKKAFATTTHIGIMDSLVDNDRPSEAEAYLNKHRGEMDMALLAKSNMEKSIRTAGEAVTGARLARQFVTGSTPSVVRPWDKNLTPIPRVDHTKALAELAKLEADPAVPERVKQAAREHTQSLVSNAEQSWKGMLDDTYQRAVTKLANNGWRLSSIGQEKDFLLDDKVEGGDTWKKIIDTRNHELHRRSSAPPTPEQRAAMVKFLLTLPVRQTEYMTGDPNAFAAEWGPRLAGTDMEQAAGYVARSGITAAKPDATLSGTAIKRISQAGASAGLWGDKGPKTEADNRKYLAIYNDLLEKQAELKKQGKPLDDKTVQSVLDSWTTTGKVPGSGIVFDDRVTRVEYETSDEYEGKGFEDEIPDEWRGQAQTQLKAQGLAPTEEVLRYLWRKSKGVPDDRNPRPAIKQAPARAVPGNARQ